MAALSVTSEDAKSAVALQLHETLLDTDAFCPRCKSRDVVDDEIQGVSVCRDCGFVAKESYISDGSEWRSFSSDSGSGDNARIGDGSASSEGIADATYAGGMGGSSGLQRAARAVVRRQCAPTLGRSNRGYSNCVCFFRR
jgi:hypothetical protein